MKLNIRGDKIKVTPAIKEHIENKISKLDQYFENPDGIEATIIIRVRGLEQIIEVTLPTSKFTIRAEVSHSDLYASVDLVIDKLERQIRKNKTKISKYKNIQPMEFNFETEFEEDGQEDIKIIKRKEINSKPMDEEEAILQMELLNHDFFAFKNVDEECVSVLYKRKDGNYGLMHIR